MHYSTGALLLAISIVLDYCGFVNGWFGDESSADEAYCSRWALLFTPTHIQHLHLRRDASGSN